MGFKHMKINDKRYYLALSFYQEFTFRAYYEQSRIVHQRHSLLRRMRRNRDEGRPVVYLDETWCNAHDKKIKQWLEKDPACYGGTIGGPKGYVKLIEA